VAESPNIVESTAAPPQTQTKIQIILILNSTIHYLVGKVELNCKIEFSKQFNKDNYSVSKEEPPSIEELNYEIQILI